MNKKTNAIQLQPNKPIEKELSGGGTDRYEIQAGAGQFLHVVVDQMGIDVALALYDPDGKKIATMDSPNGAWGLEQISTIADASGAFQLDVTSGDQHARPGHYSVSISAPLLPTDADRARILAERGFAATTEIAAQGGKGSAEKILEGYEATLPLWRIANDKYEEALSLFSIGEAHNGLGEKNKALDNYLQAAALMRDAGDLRGQGDSLNKAGMMYGETGQTQKALNVFDQALQIRRAVGDQHGESEALNNLAYMYMVLGQRQKAVEYLNQALLVERASASSDMEAVTLNNLGAMYREFGKEQEALEFYRQALPLEESMGDKETMASTLNNIGEVYDDLGESQKALEYLNRALSLNRSLGKTGGEAMNLSNIGLVYARTGENQKALEYYNLALPLRQSAGDREGEAATLDCLGSLYETLGQEQKALEYYRRSVELDRAAGVFGNEVAALSNIAWVYSRLGDQQQALDYYDQALKLSRNIADQDKEAWQLNGIGFSHYLLGEKEKALSYYEQALPLERAVGDRRGEAATLANIGKVEVLLGDSKAAIRNYGEALALSREARNSSLEASILTDMMLLWQKNGSPSSAVFFGKQAINKYQQLRANIRGLEKELQHSFVKSNEKAYRELADMLISQGRLPEAEQVLDLLKDEEYFEFIRRDSKASSALTASVKFTREEEAADREYEANAERVTGIGNEYAALRGKPSRTPEEDAHLKELEQKVGEANAAWERFLSAYFEDLGKSEEARNKVENLEEHASEMQRVLRQLHPGTVALYTLITDEKYRVMLITPNVIVPREYSIKADDLRKKVEDFRRVLKDPASNPRPKAQELYNILVAPVANELEGAHAITLMWSLDGVLRYLPMSTLYDGRQYLVEKFRNTVFTPSSIPGLTSQPNISAWHGLGMGVSRSYAGFEPLPAVPEELHRIIREKGATHSQGVVPGQVLLDEAFTADNMRKALEANYPLVHIASHFDFSPGNETESFLLLGGKDQSGERLKLSDLRTDPSFNFADTDLLTLSACDTAISGAVGDGREVDGIGFVAQQKGAKAVVASLWGVYDASTGVLMQEFYKRWTTHPKMPKAEALRQSQLALLHGTSAGRFSYSHPYFWGPFILIGNWK